MPLFKNQRVYDFFVSSTRGDLEDQRNQTINAIYRSGNHAVAMERFIPGFHQSQDYIRNIISESDVFILIVGRKSGSATSAGDPMYIRWEYSTAREYNKPIILFAPSDKEVSKGGFDDEILKFREELMDSGLYVNFFDFDKTSEFIVCVQDTIEATTFDLINNGVGGWIRSEVLDDYVSKKDVSANYLKSSALRSVADPIFDLEGLLPQLELDTDEKRSISRYILSVIGAAFEVESGIRRLFVEGGSTTFRFCKEFNEYCGNARSFYHNDVHNKLTIGTNSILNFLELALNIQGSTRPFQKLQFYPPPPVDDDFGQSFGSLVNIVSRTIHSYEKSQWQRDQRTIDRMDIVTEAHKTWLTKYGGMNLSIMSAAGLALGGEYQGPWVNKHESMLLQQCVYRAKEPILLVLDGKKWGSAAKEHESAYRVLFNGTNWEDVLAKQPFAVAVATFVEDKAAEIEKYFEQHDFTVLKDVAKRNLEPRKLYRVFAFNEKFSPLVI
ncbi:MAG: DUF4062 domain-containing protein [Pseudomonadota bacterium]